MTPITNMVPAPAAVRIDVAGVTLDGDLTVPERARGIVLFAHGSGSSRHSPRNRAVAAHQNAAGFATLLLDLLTPSEERWDLSTRALRFDVQLLADRLMGATDWVGDQELIARLPVGYFGASTGAASALIAAARRRDVVRAVVSRGGRPDLAGVALADVRTPTLLIVGGEDAVVIDLNRVAHRQLRCVKQLEIVSGAGHLFEEPGTLEQVARLAAGWFERFLPGG
jgi:pimeloyl-ACP methyl ester carboxylesterase